MDEQHLGRLLRELDGVDTLEALSDRISPTDFTSLQLEVFCRRAAKVTPADLMNRYREDRFVQRAQASVTGMLELDQLAFSIASAFEPVELSPVCPFGTVSALTKVSQKNVISTSRNSEVVADSTNCLALECALRRTGGDTIRLCASHRLVRAQHYKGPASFAHFRVFALCTAGRDTGNYSFELGSLSELLTTYLELLAALRSRGWGIGSVTVSLTDFVGKREDALKEGLMGTLSLQFPDVQFQFNPDRQQGRGYYDKVCFDISVLDDSGQTHSVADGGFVDWTRKLLNNQKERFLIGGLGTERVCFLFRPETTS